MTHLVSQVFSFYTVTNYNMIQSLGKRKRHNNGRQFIEICIYAMMDVDCVKVNQCMVCCYGDVH